MKRALAIVALSLAALPFAAGTASAHGCHADVERGQAGWHRHAPNCTRLSVNREFHGHREVVRPRCTNVKKCHYVGPFKECKWVQECR
jgi:hypothetical protein